VTPTTLRELRSLRLRLAELARRDEEAMAAERRICEARIALAESVMKLKKPLMTCLTETLGDDKRVRGIEVCFHYPSETRHDARQRLDQIVRSGGYSVIAETLAEIEQEIERELDQWR
jgi:hypothetical protein